MKLALPNAQNFPAANSKGARDDPVSGHIVVELALPECEPALGSICEFTSSMSVPETSVHKNRELLRRKDKIWFAEDTTISPPPGDTICSKN